MAPDSGPQGAVLRYPYLWLSQSRAGEDSGRKERPVCLVLRVRDEKAALPPLPRLAISSQPPASGQAALEIPDIDRRRAGLTAYPRAWIYVSEWNYDIAERSFHLDPALKPLGHLTPRFLAIVARAFSATVRLSRARVDRTR